MLFYRSRYSSWKYSKLAKWLETKAGLQPPICATREDWRTWRQETAKKFPVTYYITRTVLPYVQNVVMFPSDVYFSISIYVKNRFVDKMHVLRTGLPVGSYYDLDYRILCAVFTSFVEFIEKEKTVKGLFEEIHCAEGIPLENALEEKALYYYWKCRDPYDFDCAEDDLMLERLMKIRKNLWT